MRIGARLVALALIVLRFLPTPIATAAAAAAAADNVHAASSGSTQVAALGAAFVANLPAGWTSVQGAWTFLDPLACWQNGTNCGGGNPSTPYGYPTLPVNGVQQEYFQLNPTDAVVIFYQTPPTVAYYAFTQYLTSLPGQPAIYASLSDSLNLLEITTIGSAGPGQNMFNSLAVVVWSANLSTYKRIVTLLAKQGIAAANVNFIPLPIKMGTYPGWRGARLAPLQMGVGPDADVFDMLMRAGLPSSQADWQTYVASAPFFVVRVSPSASVAMSPAPSVGFASETTGILEGTSQQTLPQLQQALNDLAADVKATNSMAFSFSDLVVRNNDVIGWKCIADDIVCGDNHDELSILDSTTPVTFKNLNDVVIVVGVNHVATNKGLYFNHSVYDVVNDGPVSVVTNQDVSSASALYWAGVTSPSDPRVQEYQNLYAVAFSYDCTALQYCWQIPAPAPGNPVGLPPGSPFALYGRVVEDPARVDPPLTTFVRPSAAEIVTNQTLLGTRNTTETGPTDLSSARFPPP